MNDLQQLFQEITEQWVASKAQEFTSHPLANKFRSELVDAVKEIVEEVSSDFIVKGSVGAGNWANVPWLSMLDPDLTQTTQDGIYPVYLFKADGSGVYLSLNQGATNPINNLGRQQAVLQAKNFADVVVNTVPGLASWGVKEIDLQATTALGRSYEVPNIIAKYYPSDAIPSSEDLKKDLVDILLFYEKLKPIWLGFLNSSGEEFGLVSGRDEAQRLPKSFILLAGISGTGKTNFVREQAKLTGSLEDTYCLVPVRPDWHEPSDVMGYVSRLSAEGPRYVVSDVLRFMVSAWKEIVTEVGFYNGQWEWKGRDLENVRPFWLCLDEMNLAPVEQYFSDFLSILETRRFLNTRDLEDFNFENDADNSYVYTCEPILKSPVISQLDESGRNILRADLGLQDDEFDNLWSYFCSRGVALPFNLVVAGTVNMDETTHGFSRKVIDRALTIDFGEFFPNDFALFFKQENLPVALGYPVQSTVTSENFSAIPADPEGSRSVKFLTNVNEILRGSAFELAYRALNELLLSVVCFAPTDEETLYAVWDDFLMMKLLPRIEGDQEKLSVFNSDDDSLDGSQDLLERLYLGLEEAMAPIWNAGRPDLFRKPVSGDLIVQTKCRTRAKVEWMRRRLESHGFTSFWP